VLGQFSYANLELVLVKAEGFTRELGLDPRRLDDAVFESIRQRVQNAGIFVSSLDLGGNHIDPDPAKRETQNQSAMKMTELAGKVGVAYTGGREPSKTRRLRNKWMRFFRGYTGKYFR
jgi:sugar phosphate isomerase/epimerase